MGFTNSRYAHCLGWVRQLKAGEAYRAEKGVDFDCQPQSFASVLYAVAKEKGWKATVVLFPDSVIFAFYKSSSYMRPNLAAYPIVKKYKGEQA